MKRFTLGLVVVGMAGAGPAHAQLASSDAPILVESQIGDLLRSECKGVYEGDVVATQSGARLTTDKLILQGSRPDSRSPQCEIERVIAEANVIYATPNLRIRSERAEYDRILDAITFTGNVILTGEDGSLMSGASLVYTLADERARIAAGDKPVEMIITPSRRDRYGVAN